MKLSWHDAPVGDSTYLFAFIQRSKNGVKSIILISSRIVSPFSGFARSVEPMRNLTRGYTGIEYIYMGASRPTSLIAL